MNELDRLKRLSAVRTNAGVGFLTPAAFPGNHCPLHTALALGSNVRGMSTLVIGTPECGIYSRTVVERSENAAGGLHWMYVLDSNEVVFGCRNGLIGAIEEMARAGAEAIMLISTCVPEVIGEDIEGIVQEVQPRIGARLIFVQLGHFKCNSHPSGFWKTLVAFGDLMKKGDARPDIINVLGRSPDEDHIPMPELLTALEERGFRLRYLAPRSNIEDIINAPDAMLNLVLSPYMNPLAEMMRQRHQVPFISLHETYDIPEVDLLYGSVAEALGIDRGRDLEERRQKALLLQERATAALPGVRYIATHRNALAPLPLALYLARFRTEPLLLHMEEFYPHDRKWAKALIGKGQDPLICHMVNERADAAILEHLCPDISFGEIPGGTGRIPCVPHLYELQGQIGYERTALLLNRTLSTLEGAKRQGAGRDRHGDP